MKTERRHELQENELAGWLAEKVQTVRPHLKTIGAIIALLAVAYFCFSVYASRTVATKEAAWAAYFDAVGNLPRIAADFEEVAETYPGSDAAGWALQTAGDLYLYEGIRALYTDRSTADSELENARKAYEGVLNTFSDEMLLQRASLGLGKCLESEGKIDDAKSRYQTLADKWPDSQIAVIAKSRLDALEQSETQVWYQWFAEQEPAPNPLSDPSMLQGLPNLPDEADLQMPEPGQLLGPSGDTINPDTISPESTAPSADEDVDSDSIGPSIDLEGVDLNSPGESTLPDSSELDSLDTGPLDTEPGNDPLDANPLDTSDGSSGVEINVDLEDAETVPE